MRNPLVLCNIQATRPCARACIFHKTLSLMLYPVYKIAAGHRPIFRAINTNDLAKEHMVSPCDRSIIWGVAQFIQACARVSKHMLKIASL